MILYVPRYVVRVNTILFYSMYFLILKIAQAANK